MPFQAKPSGLRAAVEAELLQNEQQQKLGLSDNHLSSGAEKSDLRPLPQRRLGEDCDGGGMPKSESERVAASPAQDDLPNETRFRIRHQTLGWFASIAKTEWEGCKFTEQWTLDKDKSPSFTLEELRSRQLMSLLVSGYTGLELVPV